MALLPPRRVGPITIAVSIREFPVTCILISAQPATARGMRARGAFMSVAEVVNVGFGGWGRVLVVVGRLDGL